MMQIEILENLPAETLHIANSDSLEKICDGYLGSNAIVLNFPTFTDGRAFSQARRLRRSGFKGELIASGDIRSDQARFYAQVGFSALYFTHGYNKKVIESNLNRYTDTYQNSAFTESTVFDRRIAKIEAARLSGGGAF